jgi:hypothetical protein
VASPARVSPAIRSGNEQQARIAKIHDRTHALIDRAAFARVDMLDAIAAAQKARAGEERGAARSSSSSRSCSSAARHASAAFGPRTGTPISHVSRWTSSRAA